jgi:short-subunit dehydrogenase
MKKNIITGATGGIGKGVSSYLAANDYELILSSRKEENNKIPKHSTFYLLDFNSLDSIVCYEQWIKEAHSPLDGVVLIIPKPLLRSSCRRRL